MNIKQDYDNGLLTILLDGELDASSAISVDDVIKEAYDREQYNIVFDCQELKYISSAGLGVFVSYLEEFKEKNGQLLFFGMSDSVYEIFRILGLDRILNIFKSKMDVKTYLDEN